VTMDYYVDIVDKWDVVRMVEGPFTKENAKQYIREHIKDDPNHRYSIRHKSQKFTW